MRSSRLYYFPLALPFLLMLLLVAALSIFFIEIGLIGYAYEKIGISARHVYVLLLLSLLGSYVNIPVGELPEEQVLSGREVTYFGMRYVIPLVEERPRTVIAVNLGGAVIPTILSFYLLTAHDLYAQSLAGTAAVALIVHRVARPLEGVGIVVPAFIPPLAATASALLISRESPPALAYIAGSLGTLIGADLMNLGKIRGLGAPVASIGGAGTFDAIFLTGILAVLLA